VINKIPPVGRPEFYELIVQRPIHTLAEILEFRGKYDLLEKELSILTSRLKEKVVFLYKNNIIETPDH